MSFMLELRGRTNGQWPLSTVCLEQINRLYKTDARGAVESLFGDEKTEDGTLRTVSKQDLLDAVKEVAREARKIPGGFQIRLPPMHEGEKSSVGGGSVSGLLIDGKYHAIRCFGDHWAFREVGEGKPQPTPRYDAAVIPTENFGIIKIEPIKSARSELSKLVRDVQKFLEGDPSDKIRIIWG